MGGEDTAVPRLPRGVFVGLATLDVVQRVGTLPTSNRKATAARQDIAAGGPALNAAVTFAALGGDATLISYVGEGAAARIAKEDLAACNVQLIDLAQPGFSLPVSSIVVEESTGNRQIVSTDATAAGAPVAHSPDATLTRALDNCDIALFDGHHQGLAQSLAGYLHASSRPPMILDAGRWKPSMHELIPLMSEVICSADFRLGSGPDDNDLLQDLLRAGVDVAAATNGAAPIRWATRDDSGTVPAEQTEVVDSLAAGDAFHGAYAFARAAHGHRTAAPGEISKHLAFAAHIAAIKCSHTGTRSWLSRLRPPTGEQER